MERYENIIKIEEIRRLIDENLYTKAAKILDTMDISRIKALTDLSILADVLTQNERYEEAMEILLKIYNKSKTRRVLYQLVDISIRMEDLESANEYLELYIKVAPTDSQRFIFRYCIDKLNQEPYEVLLDSLEQLKEYEYIEMWAYELAKVYHKAGMKDKCVRECSDIILWFGEGVYVEKARLLKAFYVGEINPAHIINAKNKKEALKQLNLEKTKDYSAMRDEINQYLAKEEKEVLSKSPEPVLVKNEVNMETENKQDLIPVHETVLDSIQEPTANTDLTEVNEMVAVTTEQDLISTTCSPLDNIEEIESEEHRTVDTDEPNINPDLFIKNHLNSDDIFHEDNLVTPIKSEADIEAEAETDIYGYLTQAGFHVTEEFGAFLLVDSLKDQIQNALESILSDAKNINHLVIGGGKRSGRSTLAKRICKGLFALNWIKSPRVAKITGNRLNQVNLSEQKERLKDSTIIIENAGHMTEAACERLVDFMQDMRDNVFVILEDEYSNLEELFARVPFISTYFKERIILRKYTERDLFHFAEEYINEQNYQFLSEAKSEFFQKIGQILSESDVPLERVMDLAKVTVKSADNRYKSQLAEILNNRNLDTEDLLYIVKEDIAED